MRPGIPLQHPTPGPASRSGAFSTRAASSPAPVSFPLVYCPGRICLGCDHEIPEIGVRLIWGPVTTYAHMDCAHELIADIPELQPA